MEDDDIDDEDESEQKLRAVRRELEEFRMH